VNPKDFTQLELAVNQQLDQWAIEHPSLAGAIDRQVAITRTVERLEDTPEYKALEEKYVNARHEIAFETQLVALIDKYLPLVLAAL
jgi:hypothetical protein